MVCYGNDSPIHLHYRHGTIFGSDQSGSRDVGIDLQTVILQNAVDDLKTQFILSGKSMTKS